VQRTRQRGHLFLTLNVTNPNQLKNDVRALCHACWKLYWRVGQIEKKFKLAGTLEVRDLLLLPNLFSTEEKTLDEKTRKLILSSTEDVLELLISERLREGRALEKDITKRSVVLQKNITEIEALAENLWNLVKKEVNDSMGVLGAQTSDAAETQRLMLYNELNKIGYHRRNCAL